MSLNKLQVVITLSNTNLKPQGLFEVSFMTYMIRCGYSEAHTFPENNCSGTLLKVNREHQYRKIVLIKLQVYNQQYY